MNSYEFSKYLETVLPEFLAIKSRHKTVLKEGGKFAPHIYVDISKYIIFINFTIIDKGGYHNKFGRDLITYGESYISKLYSEFLIEKRNNKIDIINGKD